MNNDRNAIPKPLNVQVQELTAALAKAIEARDRDVEYMRRQNAAMLRQRDAWRAHAGRREDERNHAMRQLLDFNKKIRAFEERFGLAQAELAPLRRWPEENDVIVEREQQLVEADPRIDPPGALPVPKPIRLGAAGNARQAAIDAGVRQMQAMERLRNEVVRLGWDAPVVRQDADPEPAEEPDDNDDALLHILRNELR